MQKYNPENKEEKIMKKIVTVSILATCILTAIPIAPVFAATTDVKTENVLMDRKRFDHIKSKETSRIELKDRRLIM